MERRTLLRNLVSSMVAVPVLGTFNTTVNARALVEAADEQYMQRAIRLAGNVPKYPFGAVFGSSISFLKTLDWWAIDIRADELSRLAKFRNCTVVGGVLEEECNKLFRTALNIK